MKKSNVSNDNGFEFCEESPFHMKIVMKMEPWSRHGLFVCQTNVTITYFIELL